MTDSYCGKDCDECKFREELNCPGCRKGPGKPFSTGCEIAMCCREKGTDRCAPCLDKSACMNYRNRDLQAELRRDRQEREQQLARLNKDRAPILARWLSIMFWLIVPSTIADILTNRRIVSGLSAEVYNIALIITVACSVVYAAILLRISLLEERYLKAGAFCMIVALADILLTFVIKDGALALIISLVVIATGILAKYYEFNAHSEILAGMDDELSEKWLWLWKWTMYCLLGMIVAIILAVLHMVLSILLLLVTGIGIFVLSILKSVYLYRTAAVFREYPTDNQ